MAFHFLSRSVLITAVAEVFLHTFEGCADKALSQNCGPHAGPSLQAPAQQACYDPL